MAARLNRQEKGPKDLEHEVENEQRGNQQENAHIATLLHSPDIIHGMGTVGEDDYLGPKY